jgi:hypothetical protein
MFGETPAVDTVLIACGRDEPGWWREVGLDVEGKVVHRFPDQRFPWGDRGFFDPHTPPIGEAIEASCDEFDSAWNAEPILPSSSTVIGRLKHYLALRGESRDIRER